MKKTTSLLAAATAVCALALSSAAVAGVKMDNGGQQAQSAGQKTAPLFSFVIE